MRVYGTDGDQYELPCTDNILANDYLGYPCSDNKETHYPRMYVTHCYDVLSGVTKSFRYSNRNEEVHSAIEMATDLEENSLTLYDRLFVAADLFRIHDMNNSFAIVRCRDGATFTEINEFFQSKRRNGTFKIDEITIQLIKVVHPKTGSISVFATNLPRRRFKNLEINDLYALRWESETANRDMTATLKVEQWHSHSLNGVLQELYTALWLMNQTRIQMAKSMKQKCTLKTLFFYEKSNFKLIYNFILNSLKDLVDYRLGRVRRRLNILIKISKEKRIRRSRSYDRQTKYSKKSYPSASTVERRLK